MLTRIRIILRSISRQGFASVFAWLLTAGAVEPAESSWAKRIESYAALPNAYKSFFEPFLVDGQTFPYTVLTPSCDGFMHRTTEKLVCDLGCEIQILERSGNSFETHCYPLEGIYYIEVRTMLLDSSIKISGVTKQGVPATSTFEFNSVTDHLLAPIVQRIRLAPVDSNDALQRSGLEKFDEWTSLNYKFMNYAKRSLLAGEKVIATVLQPEIRKSVLKILGKTYYRTISPAHASILTDREFITIREDEKQTGEDKHGGIWDYIQLSKIVSLSLSEKSNDLLALSIQLPENVRLEYIFQASARQEINQLLGHYQELTAVSQIKEMRIKPEPTPGEKP